MKLLQIFALTCVSFLTFAESTFPTGCQPVTVKGDAVTIDTKNPTLVFIHNLGKSDLWITHPVNDPSASAGWTSRLQGNNWSSLSVDKGPFVINCIESIPGHEQKIPCEGAIGVCQWSKVKMPADAKGTFWAAEDQTLDGITAAVGTRGYVLPSKK